VTVPKCGDKEGVIMCEQAPGIRNFFTSDIFDESQISFGSELVPYPKITHACSFNGLEQTI
jgi:hypothetical protein